MAPNWKDLVPTRRSLLSRVKNWEDHKSWDDFYQIYRPLVRDTALKAGLTETEADDASQETLLAVAKAIRDFKYDREKCTFRTWLYSIARRQVANQFRKRLGKGRVLEPLAGDNRESSLVDDIPDPASEVLNETWEREWEENLKEAAIKRVQNRVSPAQFQVFEYHALQGHSVLHTARALGISPARVYLAKHRILNQVRAELKVLKAMEEQMWDSQASARIGKSGKV
jgi:RNA polymerase sigma factor (sigma-70 family)